MTRDDIQDAVLEIIADIAPDQALETLRQLDPEVSLREQLELDSMDFLDIVMELRKRYKVEVPEADYKRLATLQSTVDYLEPRLSAAAARA